MSGRVQGAIGGVRGTSPAAPGEGSIPALEARPAAGRVDAALERLGTRRLALLLFLACVVVYASNGKTLNMGDSVPARLIPIALLLDGTPMLDRFAEAIAATSRQPYFVRATPYGLASWYPIATGLVATPIVAPAVLWIQWTEAPDAASWLAISRGLEKMAATVIAALAVLLFHAVCRVLGLRPGVALLLTLTFAFGSQTFSTSAQALWQHGPGTAAILGALWYLVRAETRPTNGAVAAFSALAALAVAIRPPNLAIVAPFAALVLGAHPRRWSFLALPALTVAAALVAWNLALFGDPAGGYGATGARFTADVASALPGLLVSPGRGLFVYFPVTLVLLVLLALEPHAYASGFAIACLAAIVLVVVLTAAWPNWWGGYSYGPRLLTEVQPLVLLLVGLGIRGAGERRRRAVVAAVAVLLPLQVAIQALGTYGPPGRPPAAIAWNSSPVSIDVAPERNWDLADSPIARGLRGYDD